MRSSGTKNSLLRNFSPTTAMAAAMPSTTMIFGSMPSANACCVAALAASRLPEIIACFRSSRTAISYSSLSLSRINNATLFRRLAPLLPTRQRAQSHSFCVSVVKPFLLGQLYMPHPARNLLCPAPERDGRKHQAGTRGRRRFRWTGSARPASRAPARSPPRSATNVVAKSPGEQEPVQSPACNFARSSSKVSPA